MTPLDDKDEPRKDLELEPQLKATRLNRVAVFGLACIGILILWIALFVLGRSSVVRDETAASAAPSRPSLDLDRLERQAQRPAPRRPIDRRPPSLPAPPPPQRRPEASLVGRGPANDAAAARARRARDLSPLVTAFENPAPYAPPPSSAATPADTPRALELPYLTRGPSRQGSQGDESDPQLYRRKEAFLAEARARERSPALPALRVPPLSPLTLVEGSLIPAILTLGINSELPGQTQGLVRQDVYDSVTGRLLLIPRGSKLLGAYDHRVAWGQKRVLIAWQRLIFPDGSSIDLKGMPGADLAGVAGVRDQVNNHFVRTFGSALLLSAFTAGAQLSQPQESSSFGEAASTRQVVASAVGAEINRTATLMLRRNLDIAPTLEIRPGYSFWIQLTADLILPHAYRPSRL